MKYAEQERTELCRLTEAVSPIEPWLQVPADTVVPLLEHIVVFSDPEHVDTVESLDPVLEHTVGLSDLVLEDIVGALDLVLGHIAESFDPVLEHIVGLWDFVLEHTVGLCDPVLEDTAEALDLVLDTAELLSLEFEHRAEVLVQGHGCTAAES